MKPKIDWATVQRVGALEPLRPKIKRPSDRRGRSVIAAILSGASMKARSCGALTHAQIRAALVPGGLDALVYGIGLVAAASGGTRDQQVMYAAIVMAEMTELIKRRS